mmetsp:Transcript_14484/g.22358  ORF Transcript_14484/g.22358 Transcript_14484/m.22358 type:complete len:146 (-) Transcript_14484:228-665(-)
MLLRSSILCMLIVVAHAFAPLQSWRPSTTVLFEKGGGGGIFGAVGNFFEELDAFVDDATSRRLGAGSAFYGKRKSSFYGKEDTMKKANRGRPDPTEDYQGPAQGGYFVWNADEETGQMKPVTRMKKKNIERNPNYWDRVFAKDDD